MNNKQNKLSPKEIEHIADLARIELTPEEKEKYTKELSAILDYIDQLNEVDTSEIAPTLGVTGLVNVTREDKEDKRYKTPEEKSQERKKILANAPETKDDYIKVKAVL